MASANLLKTLIRAYMTADDTEFRSTVQQIIHDEEAKSHWVLALGLRTILDEMPGSDEATRHSPASSTPRVELVRQLFTAHSGNDSREFRRVADVIIGEELAAHHFGYAERLRDSLRMNERTRTDTLTQVPIERRNGDQLLSVSTSSVDMTQIVLDAQTMGRVERIVREQMSAELLARSGLRPKQRILFWGPPGCGKTKTGKYLAYVLGVPFAMVRADSIMSSYLGETSSHLRKVFDYASSQRAVVMFDEFDSLAKSRDDPHEVGELKRVVNSLLQMLDLYEGPSVLIAASNHQYLLDVGIWRRFDDVIEFPMPSAELLCQLAERLLSGVRVEGHLSDCLGQAEGLSFADLEWACFEVVKTMLLSETRSVSVTDIASEAKRLRDTRTRAQPR